MDDRKDQLPAKRDEEESGGSRGDASSMRSGTLAGALAGLGGGGVATEAAAFGAETPMRRPKAPPVLSGGP